MALASSIFSKLVLKGLTPKMFSKSSLKITSFSKRRSARIVNLSLDVFRISIALLYCFSIIYEIS
jgi:hypothetical protein